MRVQPEDIIHNSYGDSLIRKNYLTITGVDYEVSLGALMNSLELVRVLKNGTNLEWSPSSKLGFRPHWRSVAAT